MFTKAQECTRQAWRVSQARILGTLLLTMLVLAVLNGCAPTTDHPSHSGMNVEPAQQAMHHDGGPGVSNYDRAWSQIYLGEYDGSH